LRRFLRTLDIRSISYGRESKIFTKKLQASEGIRSGLSAADKTLRRQPDDCVRESGASLTSLNTRSYTASMLRLPYAAPVWLLLGVIAVVPAVGIGCSGKTIQYPEDHERYRRIDQAVESLRQAYEKKSASKMAELMVPTEQIDRLQRDVDSDFESFSSIALAFSVERIMIDGDDVDVFVHWQGLWKKNADDPGLRQRGHTRLQWVGTVSILLRGVEGDSPFGMKVRQAITDNSTPPSQKK